MRTTGTWWRQRSRAACRASSPRPPRTSPRRLPARPTRPQPAHHPPGHPRPSRPHQETTAHPARPGDPAWQGRRTRIRRRDPPPHGQSLGWHLTGAGRRADAARADSRNPLGAGTREVYGRCTGGSCPPGSPLPVAAPALGFPGPLTATWPVREGRRGAHRLRNCGRRDRRIRGGPDRPIGCSMPMTLARPRTT